MEFGDRKYEFKIYERILKWIVDLVLVVVLAVFVGIYIGGSMTMNGNSMDPAISNKDAVLINKLIYSFKEPERFDVIAFETEDKEHVFIKRIIGLPGETVQIKNDGKIYINGIVLEEEYKYEDIVNSGLASDVITLGEGEYFVLGDNRNNSEDSRFEDIGNVKSDSIIGEVWFTVSPLSKFGFVE